MKSSGRNISLSSLDDIFSSEEARQGGQEQIQHIPISELVPFKDHPFRVVDDDHMMETVESVKEYGVLVPIIVRPLEDGLYEIVSGHRRKRACELAGIDEIPVIIRDLDDDEATIIMVDSNLQRETILPSERAKAYQMKLEAIKHQGERRDLTCGQLGHKLDQKKTREVIAEAAGDSPRNVQRFIRLNNLEQPLLDKVDDGKLAFTIILSRHILSEVQAVCDSIMIISNGHLVASDTPENLTMLFAGTTTLHLEVKGGKEETEEVLNGIEQIEDQKIKTGDGETTLAEIKPAENVDIRETVFSAFANARLPLLEMRTVRASLEDVFLELTKGDVLPIPPKGRDDQAEQNEAKKEADDAESIGKEADEA